MVYRPAQGICSLYIYRNQNQSNGGELLLGGTDPSHFTGNLTYVTLSVETYWEIKMAG